MAMTCPSQSAAGEFNEGYALCVMLIVSPNANGIPSCAGDFARPCGVWTHLMSARGLILKGKRR